ncbi:Pr6Pr family membrane protein [Clostridium sp. MD294]|uniref:Pr6Pr family membrane protein n=1 Tax=Clostridium sp. MD294 TaxID=97138 RepID=UPI0002CC96A1|nr:Pr6Pr family membrane protein [Clostridium sp. MD294]NDO45612.1 hypothetical protein [Clostridium sp. MD294]USF30734.1 hypothetical protein C820_002177 [Clostridium sp. MD294]
MDKPYKSVKKTLYRLFLVIGCGIGLFIKLGLYQGKIKWYTLMYYTNWSNFFVFVLFLFLLLFPEYNNSKKLLNIKGGVTMMMLLTGFIYHFLLNGRDFNMEPITTTKGLGSFLLHYYTPFLVFLDWILWDKKGMFFQKAAFFWTIIPYIYMVLIFCIASKGSFIPNQNTSYPYKFIAVDLLGWERVVVNIIALSACYIAAGYVYVIFDKLLSKAMQHKR